jgi:hypothetical protein
MRKQLSIVIFCAAFSAKAQFNMLAAYHEPTLGVTGTTMYDSAGTAMPHQIGANQTWNFSALSTTASASTGSYVLPSTTPNASLFPGATLAADGGTTGSVAYFKSSASMFELLGYSFGTLNIVYSDPWAIYKWPISYSTNNNFTDAYQYSMSSGGFTMNISAQVSSSVTGHGTLTLPGGLVLNNVMQIHAIDTQTMTNSLTPGTTTAVSIYKQYYHSSQRYPILSYMYSKSQSSPSVTATYEINHLLAVGIAEQEGLCSNSGIFPNPAHGSFRISCDETKGADVRITLTNIIGQVMRNISADGVSEIDISDLPAGVYTVRISSGPKFVVRKLVVE